MRDNRARRRAGKMLVDGYRETRRAMESGLEPTGVYVLSEETRPTPGPQESAADRDWVHRHAGAALQTVSAAVMQKIAYGQSARGVVAEFQAPGGDLSSLTLPSTPLILVLDQVEKPGNVGAAFRCADAAGVDAVILTPAESDRYNPNAIRSSLGAVFTVASAVADETDARRWLRAQGIPMFAARVESSRPLWATDLSGAAAIIVGSEALGLGDRWDGPQGDVQGVHIPMAGQVDSLNVSVSAAVLLYEAARQRRH
ncbi:RNA methyltransferase [Roseiconus nitratireducens]|uniref:RNA methyltransferase n=2 Tax=Roseiconus nitratireducens TaxID=2605748 RepID=A0A5M6DH33_9BACT|nr:RNA methyltransferase [Roseiconus nitratireducens]